MVDCNMRQAIHIGLNGRHLVSSFFCTARLGLIFFCVTTLQTDWFDYQKLANRTNTIPKV